MDTYQLTIQSNQEELKIIRPAFTAADAITQIEIEYRHSVPKYSVTKCEPVEHILKPNTQCQDHIYTNVHNFKMFEYRGKQKK